MNIIFKAPAESDCSIVLTDEFIAVDDDNVCSAPIMTDKDILEFVQSSKNIDEDSDDPNEMKNAAPVPTSSEMRNIMRTPVCDHLDRAYSGRWIGCADPVLWPPRSPDLTPLDFLHMGQSQGIGVFRTVTTQMDLVACRHAACPLVDTAHL
ncbi:hypothetical protein TNCV_3548501 [Trichonephila clavipes]|nr:hypothetical protein TNCV_3548501 [Trichonephila clavipes]